MSTTAYTVLKVVDTRSYEEQGDRWVPIPGSGNAHACCRCGRDHEVHAYVATPSGEVEIVGTGCMGLTPEQSRKEATKAGTVAKLRAQLAKAEAFAARVAAAEAAVSALPVPAITAGKDVPWGPMIACGDSEVSLRFARTPADIAHQEEQARMGWRDNRVKELVGGGYWGGLAAEIKALQKKLARYES